jgi:hypothetical protein
MPKTVKTKTSAKDQATLFNNIIDAQNNDIAVGKKSKESAKDVATKWDLACGDINWTTIAFNKSAASNNMEEGSFKLLKKIRTSYRDGWMEDNDNFDQRWQYVRKQSKHYKPKAGNADNAGKSTEAKLEEAIRAVHRHATTLEAHEEIDLALELMSLRGIVLKTAEED